MRSRRSRKRNGRQTSRSPILLLFATAAVLAVGIFFLLYPSSLSSQASNSQWIGLKDNPQLDAIAQSPSDSSVAEVPRVVYPYSVVPGGVRTPEELQAASARDRVVGEHYAGFDFRKARVIKVKKARLVYLSYRIGDQIYWTAKKVSLHAGENLITDGKVTARTRCGNRVSALPQKKTSSQEPTMAQFDGPIGISTRDPFPENFHSALESRPGPGWAAPAMGPAGLFALGPGGASPLGGGYLPIGSPLVPGGSNCSHTGNSAGTCGTTPGSGPTPPGGPPSVPVPEPGTFVLVLAEIFAVILCSKIVFKRIRLARFPK